MTKRKLNPLPRELCARTHGHSPRNEKPSQTYNSWRGMIERCKPDRAYGVRGIVVCERWRVFANFLEDMGERPAGKQIDRKDPLGNYTPENCQWLEERPNRQYRSTTRLDEAARAEVQRLRGLGQTYIQIARALKVSKSCIGGYLRGEAWGPVQRPDNPVAVG